MTGIRSLGVAVLSGMLIAAFTGLIWRWPIPFAVGLSVTAGVVAWVTSMALGRDTTESDEAWRRAAPELQDLPVDPDQAGLPEGPDPDSGAGPESARGSAPGVPTIDPPAPGASAGAAALGAPPAEPPAGPAPVAGTSAAPPTMPPAGPAPVAGASATDLPPTMPPAGPAPVAGASATDLPPTMPPAGPAPVAGASATDLPPTMPPAGPAPVAGTSAAPPAEPPAGPAPVGGDPASRLRAEGLDPGTWSNGPGDVYGAHAHDYDKVLVCVEGSIVFGLPATGASEELRVGDRLDLPAGTRHEAFVGPAGVTCLEAHLLAGRLSAPSRRASGTW